MNSRKIYAGFVIALLLAALLLSRHIDPENKRIRQHLTYNTDVEDSSLSVAAGTFSTRLPIVKIGRASCRERV